MSRIGKQPVQLPDKVQVTLDGDNINVKGPKGSLGRKLHPAVNVEINDNVLSVSTDTSNKKKVALQGLFRSLIFNMVHGVTVGYEKKLVLSGIGYRAEAKGKSLVLNVGYSNPVEFALPEGVAAAVD
ncbi:MAG: 50S ribosomal protein L6, partial [Desulfobacterales bacterium]|nr:50S ribosomal protein L6 [Desulfobacterales bacterium]